MSSMSKNSDEQGKQPANLLLNVFSGLFNRDRSTSSDMESAVLTSFKELSHGIPPQAEGGPAADAKRKEKERHQGDLTALTDKVHRTESSNGDSEKQVKAASVDPDLVLVTRVETYSDTENDDEEADHNHNRPEQDNNTARCEDEDGLNITSEAEYQVPTFRTHKLTERSRVEAILYPNKFFSRSSSRSVLVSSIFTEKDSCSLRERPPRVSVGSDLAAGERSMWDVGTGESEEYEGIDCSQPVPSIISGHPTLETVGENDDETVLGCDIPASSPPKESKDDIQPCASPPAEHAKTQETSTPASSVTTSPFSSTSPPSKPPASSLSTSFNMPALFSGLLVLKKGAVGEDREVVSEIKQREKDADLALLSLKKTVNRAKLFPELKTPSPVKKQSEPKSVAETKSAVMGQLCQLLNLDSHEDTKESDNVQEADAHSTKDNGEDTAGDKTAGPETATPPLERKKTSDVAYETFSRIFGPKTAKKEKTEDVDLEALKKKIRNDKESLRSIFERTSKSPSKDLKSPAEDCVCRHI